MIKHYIKIAFRSIFKDKTYSIINLLGLSIAIACCFLLIFWIKFELSFDTSYPNSNRIYKILEVEKRSDGLYKKDQIRPGIYQKIKEAFPEIELSTVVSHEELPMIYEENEGILTDYTTTTPEYLEIFEYEFVEGSKESVLKNQGSIMSEETAKKFFGKESAIGRTVTFGNFVNCTIEGVVKVPQNTHMKFDVLDLNRTSGYGTHYILLKKNAQFTPEKQKNMANFLGTTRETANKLAFQPLTEIHLHSPEELAVSSSWQTYGNLQQIYLFSLAALLILLIAIINYVNTSTARAMNRVKEVGVRKVAGSTQRQLVLRFLSEAFIISTVSIILSLVGVKFFFPEFSMIMGNQTTFSFGMDTILIAIGVCIIITLLSGGYAAFYLSSFNPVTVFRGGSQTGSREGLRKVLIGFQFFLSIFILICTLFIYRQINYIFTADTGVDKNNIIVLNTNLWYEVDDFIQIIKHENPNVIDATIAFGAPYNAEYGYSGVSWEGSSDAVKDVEFSQIFCDYHYANTFGLKLVAGEFIQKGWSWWQDTEEESLNIVINEAFKRLMGVENPIGITVNYAWGFKGKIIGVVKDFNFKPLKEPISPLIISFNPEVCNKLYIKISGKDKQKTLEYILKKYKEMSWQVIKNKLPVSYHTVEDDYNKMYQVELRTAKILLTFSVISLCLSLMGIFGMVSFMVEKRTKEIAIRKINGAETKDVISLFVNDFAKLIGWASLVAIPASFLVIHQWLQTYVYRTPLSWWIFILIPALILLLTAGLIALQVWITTRQNPVESLRSE